MKLKSHIFALFDHNTATICVYIINYRQFAKNHSLSSKKAGCSIQLCYAWSTKYKPVLSVPPGRAL